MSGVMLFCVSEESKPFVRKAMNHNWDPPAPLFYLVESRDCPPDSKGFKRELKADETFETDFIGASEEDCQNWLMDKQYQHLFMAQDFVFIADERSAKDDTLLVKVYNRGEGIYFESDDETLPPIPNTWYDFRVHYTEANRMYSSLYFGPFVFMYRAFYARKEDFTDQHGVFSMARIRLILEDPNACRAFDDMERRE